MRLSPFAPLATGNPFLGAEVGLGVNDTIDSLQNGQFPLAGLLDFAGIPVAGDLIGDLSGGVNSGPWNEQIPIGGGLGGGLNTGTVFGNGNTGPFIFSAQPGSSSSPWALDPLGTTLQTVGTFSSGAADFLTFGITKKINQWDGGAVSIDYNSGTYTAGKVTGIGLTVLSTVAGGLTAGALREGKIVGGIFGRGGPIKGGLLNRGVVRFGWGWEGSAPAGRDVIRLGIGAARGTNWWSHIPIWYP